jgi:hypothetical protein
MGDYYGPKTAALPASVDWKDRFNLRFHAPARANPIPDDKWDQLSRFGFGCIVGPSGSGKVVCFRC